MVEEVGRGDGLDGLVREEVDREAVESDQARREEHGERAGKEDDIELRPHRPATLRQAPRRRRVRRHSVYERTPAGRASRSLVPPASSEPYGRRTKGASSRNGKTLSACKTSA